MIMERFTVEEINLICIYNKGSRDELISELIDAITDFEDEDMFEIAHNALEKVSKMSGAEFAALEFYPEYGDDEQEEAVVDGD